MEFFSDDWEVPRPRVFFVRVADKGLTVDGASRASKFGELNAEALRGREEGVGFATSTENGSRDFYYRQGLLLR